MADQPTFAVGDWVRIAGTIARHSRRLGRIRHTDRLPGGTIWHVVEFRPNVWGEYGLWGEWDEYQTPDLEAAAPTEEEAVAWLIQELSG